MISVIIPCYNAKNSIIRALNSVIDQTYKEFEVVIVDDGSSDGSKELIQEYIKKHEEYKIDYFYQKNRGPSAARNEGVKRARFEYIAFLDSDDEWHKKKLEYQMSFIKEKSMDFLGSTYQYEEFDYSKEESLELNLYSFDELLIKTRFSTPGVILKRSIFVKIGGFDESLKYAEDNDLWLRYSQLAKMYMISSPKLIRLHKAAYGESGLSSNMFKMYKGELKVLKKLYGNESINCIKYYSLILFTSIKFFRRVVINKIVR